MAVQSGVMRPTVPTVVEELSWDDPVVLHGESRPPTGGEKGFTLRLHADANCPHRLVSDGLLVARRYSESRADALCADCTGELVASSRSTVVRHLRDTLTTLRRLAAGAGEPMPREIVHARALRFEAAAAASVHPAAPALRAEVAALADDVVETLRASLLQWDRTRS